MESHKIPQQNKHGNGTSPTFFDVFFSKINHQAMGGFRRHDDTAVIFQLIYFWMILLSHNIIYSFYLDFSEILFVESSTYF
jgi:hypothetical protein